MVVLCWLHKFELDSELKTLMRRLSVRCWRCCCNFNGYIPGGIWLDKGWKHCTDCIILHQTTPPWFLAVVTLRDILARHLFLWLCTGSVPVIRHHIISCEYISSDQSCKCAEHSSPPITIAAQSCTCTHSVKCVWCNTGNLLRSPSFKNLPSVM